MSETVSSITTMTIRDVVQLGTTSTIHISAAKKKMAIIRCCTAVSPSIPKNDVGTAHKKTVIASTTHRSTMFFTETLFCDIYLKN